MPTATLIIDGEVAALFDHVVLEQPPHARIEAEQLSVEKLGRGVSHRQHGSPRPLHQVDLLGSHRHDFANHVPVDFPAKSAVCKRIPHRRGASGRRHAPFKIRQCENPSRRQFTSRTTRRPPSRSKRSSSTSTSAPTTRWCARSCRSSAMRPGPLVLDGDELELQSVSLNGKTLQTVIPAGSREADHRRRARMRSTLETLTRIVPQKNTKLEGLYATKNGFVTQCEAQGFRRITWFIDRPDVMATFTDHRARRPDELPGAAVERQSGRLGTSPALGEVRRSLSRSPATCSRWCAAECSDDQIAQAREETSTSTSSRASSTRPAGRWTA